ncbi:hypothetical protein FACS1894109_01560 [Spirochaetia bacterium]|nr:hypothetical protein FACS1894109_01560 [Spirochaetia bacterium]
MKIAQKTSSWIAAFLGWALLSALTVFVIWGLRDRARLIRDNDNERILNALFTSQQDFDDFGSAIEANPVLAERIAGFAIYDRDLAPIYSWGQSPEVFDEGMLEGTAYDRFGRYTIPDRKGRRVQFVIRTERMFMLSAPPPNKANNQNRERNAQRNPLRQNNDRVVSPFFNALAGSAWFYINISHPAYWRTNTLTAVFFPFIELILLALVFYIRHLYLRNREYRERIEAQAASIAAQKNLVVLGTAASTLAHEIKNPLLSIRLQTGILQKMNGENAGDEISRINEEVDRISSLVYRVNDFLRDAAGNRIDLKVYDVLAEVSQRLCGRNIISDDSIRDGVICADPDRIRSVFENLIRNALEAGGPPEEIGASIIRNAGNNSITINVVDRGKGISEADLKRVFDPFFTSKSTGTGIGLSISKRFVEAAGGSIELKNRDNGGAAAELLFNEDK